MAGTLFHRTGFCALQDIPTLELADEPAPAIKGMETFITSIKTKLDSLLYKLYCHMLDVFAVPRTFDPNRDLKSEKSGQFTSAFP